MSEEDRKSLANAIVDLIRDRMPVVAYEGGECSECNRRKAEQVKAYQAGFVLEAMLSAANSVYGREAMQTASYSSQVQYLLGR